MPAALTRFRTFYGAHPLHLLAVLASFALLGYIISVAGPATFWNPAVWWQSILVWFLGAALLHDLVLFPLYALGDRLHTAGVHTLRRRRGHHPDRPPHVSPSTTSVSPSWPAACCCSCSCPASSNKAPPPTSRPPVKPRHPSLTVGCCSPTPRSLTHRRRRRK